MNYLLEIAGALIYFVCSVIISPLIMLVYAMIFLVSATRYVNAYLKAVRKARQRNRRQPAEQYPWNFELVLQKLHVFGYKR
jgi:hypothetical protein